MTRPVRLSKCTVKLQASEKVVVGKGKVEGDEEEWGGRRQGTYASVNEIGAKFLC